MYKYKQNKGDYFYTNILCINKINEEYKIKIYI